MKGHFSLLLLVLISILFSPENSSAQKFIPALAKPLPIWNT